MPAIPLRLDHQNAELARITVIDWTLGNACNYACSYCPASLHDGSIAWPPLARVTRFCDRLVDHFTSLGRELLFQFSGGEPTVYPTFLELIRRLHERQCKVGLISNGSRTLRWWREAVPALDQAVLTHHIEFVDRDHFISVVAELAARIRTHVNVTMLPERFDECVAAAGHIAAECADITLTLKPLLIGFGSESYPYTHTQRETISRTSFAIRRTRPIAESRGPMCITYDDGGTETRRPADLIVAGQNHFKGWECLAGVELLAIDARGDVYRGLCRQGGRIGHIDDDAAIQFPTGPVTCTRDTCHCATDLMTTRYLSTRG